MNKPVIDVEIKKETKSVMEVYAEKIAEKNRNAKENNEEE